MSKKPATAEILAALMRRERLNQMQATSRWGITRLASVIFELRKRGHDIVTESVTSAGRTHAVYYLNTTRCAS